MDKTCGNERRETDLFAEPLLGAELGLALTGDYTTDSCAMNVTAVTDGRGFIDGVGPMVERTPRITC
jgi:hypothetical protein